MTRMSPQPTRKHIGSSIYRSHTNHELVARVIARKRVLFDLGIEPEEFIGAPEPWSTVQEKRSIWDMFRRKM